MRVVAANHLAFLELADTLHDPAAFTIGGPHGLQQHEKERLAVIASQPLARIARLCWPDPSYYLRDIEGFHRTLRPACRRCTARHGITGPIPCRLPPHQALCRRHQLWTGPSARSHDSQLDVSPFPEIGRAHRRHLALVHQHGWQHVDIAAATPPAPSTRPSATAAGSRASESGCNSSPRAAGSRPWTARSVPAPA